MSDPVLVSIISSVSTALVSIVAIIMSSRLTNYHIAQLEEKVTKHNITRQCVCNVNASGQISVRNDDAVIMNRIAFDVTLPAKNV